MNEAEMQKALEAIKAVRIPDDTALWVSYSQGFNNGIEAACDALLLLHKEEPIKEKVVMLKTRSSYTYIGPETVVNEISVKDLTCPMCNIYGHLGWVHNASQWVACWECNDGNRQGLEKPE
jgi:hypothetical protein